MNKMWTWAEAVRAVAKERTDAGMRAVAVTVIDRIHRDEWQAILAEYLVADARRQQRRDSLQEERNAERPKKTSEEWAEWRERKRERKARDVEQAVTLRAGLGLPPEAGPGDVIMAAVDRFKAAVKVDWTRELLGTTFALSDGTKVKWGDATIIQHRARLGMFKAQAKVNLQGAARHQQAIVALNESGARSLNEMVSVAA